MTRFIGYLRPEQLKEWRALHHMRQSDLAVALGVSERTVAGWEQGRFQMPPYLTLALAALVDGHGLRDTVLG